VVEITVFVDIFVFLLVLEVEALLKDLVVATGVATEE